MSESELRHTDPEEPTPSPAVTPDAAPEAPAAEGAAAETVAAAESAMVAEAAESVSVAESAVEAGAAPAAEVVAESAGDAVSAAPAAGRHLRKVLSGIVVSDKMDKTIVVKVDRRTAHPLYGKVVRVSKKYYAHDEGNEARLGDVVRLMETRPLSKLKRWRLVGIERRAATE